MPDVLRGLPQGLARLPRLPGLDGIRAVAVAGVVLYHLGVPGVPGGFLGVDVFFVLSGFLITTLVLEEIEGTGRLDVRRFYLRRARRLLPGLFVLLAVLSLLAVLMVPEERGELRRDVTAALVYVSNWSYVLTDQSYFEAVGRPPLLQHLWSLAVEEQFYLLWPAVVVAAMAAGRRRVRRIALVAAAASVAWMAVLAARHGYPLVNDPSRAYFGTDTHAMGLLLGAGLATCWTPWRVWRSDDTWLTSARPTGHRAGAALVDLLGIVALGGVVWTFCSVGEFSPALYRGGFLGVAACTAVLVAAVSHPAGVLGRLLGVGPLRYLGERSYGIYLWHWPVALLTRPGFELPFGGLPSVLLRLGIILAAAELSYRYVERPIRAGALGRLTWRLRAPGPHPGMAGAGVVSGALGLALGLTSIGLVVFTAPASTGSPSTDAGQVQPAPGSAARPAPADDGGVPPVRDGARGRGQISVFGDSVAYGAGYQLRAAGATVSAAEGRTFDEVLAHLSAAHERGDLAETVVLHAGNNGPVDEDALADALEDLSDRRLYLVNLHVPQTWEGYNNALFQRVAEKFPHVTLLDWHGQVSSHEAWLYPDQTHLTAEAGRDGYADWLLDQVRS